MKKILVLGGTGFLGFHICKKLSKIKNYKITSLSLNNYNKKLKALNINCIKANLLKKKTYNLIKNKNYDFVINAAGYGGNNSINKDKKNNYSNHLKIIKNLLNSLSFQKKIKLIHFGSSSEYGKSKSPVRESKKCKPLNAYGKSKLEATNYIIKFKHKNFKFVIFRLFQIYGEFQKKDKLIPFVIDRCMQNKKFNVSHGNQYRDYLHVCDLTNAIREALINSRIDNKIINLGSGQILKVKEIVMSLVKIINKGNPLFGSKKINIGEQLLFYPSLKKAKHLLKWRPKINFIEGVNRLIRDY